VRAQQGDEVECHSSSQHHAKTTAALVAIPVAAALQLLAQELLFPALDDA